MHVATELILAAGDGMTDTVEEQLSQIIQMHSRFVYKVAYSLLRNHHDAEDVVQETFLRVIDHLNSLPLVRNQRAWLGCIARRLALNKLRKPVPIHIEDFSKLVELRNKGATPEELANRTQMRDLAEKLTTSLPEDLREALQLSLIEGLTSREVGEILEIPESTVRNRIFRAKKILRQKLDALFGGDYDRLQLVQ